MIYKTFDIIIVPFPFTDRSNAKKRPALVLSSPLNFNAMSNNTVMAMITSAKHIAWPLDVPINDLKSAKLSRKSVIRIKFFTLDNRLIIKKIGSLAKKDQKCLKENVTKLFSDLII